MEYSLQEAADLLQIHVNTLKRRLRDAQIPLGTNKDDHRKHSITEEVIRSLADQYRRPITITKDSYSLEDRVVRLEQENRLLHGTIQDLLERVRKLEGAPIERFILTASEHATGRPSVQQTALSGAVIAKTQVVIRDALERMSNITGDPPVSEQDEMTIVWQSEKDIFAYAPLLRQTWRDAIRSALTRWRITHLIQQPTDVERSITVVEDMIHFLGRSKEYTPYYFDQSDALTPASDYILIPGKGLIEIVLPAHDHADSSAVWYPQSDRRFNQIATKLGQLRQRSKPLATRYPLMSKEFSQTIAELDGRDGDRGLVMNGLSELTVPYELHEQRVNQLAARRGDADPDVVQAYALLPSRKAREEQLKRQLRQGKWTIRDICPMRVIEDYVLSGIYSQDDIFHALGCAAMSSSQRREHLRRLVERLATTPYELGLVEDRAMLDSNLYRTFWLVKSPHAVLIESWRPGPRDARHEIDLAITDPGVVEAFHTYFTRRLWERLEPANRDKSLVINWLNSQIERIPPDAE